MLTGKLYTKLINDLNIDPKLIKMYGDNMAKIDINMFKDFNKNESKAKLVLVTATNPTNAGEGKTTTAIGLTDALNMIKKRAVFALREPSMGPVFGLKGCATGGGECELVPRNEINLHFLGDFHAITSANNLVSAVIDNHLYMKESPLKLDPNRILWKRCLDVNDRALRNITLNIKSGLTRTENFQITAASEMMAILSLCRNWDDLQLRLNRALIAYDTLGKPVYLKQLNITGALLALLIDAFKPNCVLTKHGSIGFVHCGPFANIAHGTNSVISTTLGLQVSDYVITEAGFGSDLGFEKYMDIINYQNNFIPDCVVLVASIRALKLHGGCPESELSKSNLESLKEGLKHLEAHCNIIKNYNLNFLININSFANDHSEEVDFLIKYLENKNYNFVKNTAYINGPKGALDLAQKVLELTNEPQTFTPLYNLNDSIEIKLDKIITKIYQISNYEIMPKALDNIKELNKIDEYKTWPICMVKSHKTLAGNNWGTKLEQYKMFITEIKVNSGAGFLIAYTNDVITMPGLNKTPAAEKIEVINNEIFNMR